jgi:hypothetical protein
VNFPIAMLKIGEYRERGSEERFINLRKLLVFKYKLGDAAFGLNVSGESYSHLSLNMLSRKGGARSIPVFEVVAEVAMTWCISNPCRPGNCPFLFLLFA